MPGKPNVRLRHGVVNLQAPGIIRWGGRTRQRHGDALHDGGTTPLTPATLPNSLGHAAWDMDTASPGITVPTPTGCR